MRFMFILVEVIIEKYHFVNHSHEKHHNSDDLKETL